MAGWMHGSMDGCMDVWMDAWMDGFINTRTNICMDEGLDRSMGRYTRLTDEKIDTHQTQTQTQTQATQTQGGWGKGSGIPIHMHQSKKDAAMREATPDGKPFCVWMGRRGAQLAHGVMDDMLKQVREATSGSYVIALSKLDEGKRGVIMNFETQVKSRWINTIEQKFKYAQEDPHRIAGLFAMYLTGARVCSTDVLRSAPCQVVASWTVGHGHGLLQGFA